MKIIKDILKCHGLFKIKQEFLFISDIHVQNPVVVMIGHLSIINIIQILKMKRDMIMLEIY